MKKGEITIRYMQEYLRRKQGQIDYCEDKNLCFVKLTEEMGELASSVLRGRPLATCKEDMKGSISEEIYDVLYYLLKLANTLGVDLEEVIPIKEEINNQRYPSGIEFHPDDPSWFEE